MIYTDCSMNVLSGYTIIMSETFVKTYTFGNTQKYFILNLNIINGI